MCLSITTIMTLSDHDDHFSCYITGRYTAENKTRISYKLITGNNDI